MGFKSALVIRAIRYIDDQPKGVDSWPAGSQIPVVYLNSSTNPYFDITDTTQGKKIVSKTVEFYMSGEHMATIIYGAKPLIGRRPHLSTKFHV